MSQLDKIWTQNLDDTTEITVDGFEYVLCYLQHRVLIYSRECEVWVVDINKEQLEIFIENILTNNKCYFNYVIEDFNNKTGIATIIYKNNYIYYTAYDDAFSRPFDFVKIKVDDIILNRLRNLSNYI